MFPLAATESNAMSVVSARKELHRSHGFEIAGKRVLELARKNIGDIELIELYSCFPLAVRVQLEELGLSGERPLTVTGAMTFGGGPLNNFVLQATVKMVQLLREKVGSTGLVTAISGMNTKQACALYASEPNPAGWQFADVTDEVAAATELTEVVAGYEGGATIAGFTVLYHGEHPWRAIAVCDLPDGNRTVAYSEDSVLVNAMLGGEFVGRTVAITDGQFA